MKWQRARILNEGEPIHGCLVWVVVGPPDYRPDEIGRDPETGKFTRYPPGHTFQTNYVDRDGTLIGIRKQHVELLAEFAEDVAFEAFPFREKVLSS